MWPWFGIRSRGHCTAVWRKYRLRLRLIGWTFFRQLNVSVFPEFCSFWHSSLSIEKILEFWDNFFREILSIWVNFVLKMALYRKWHSATKSATKPYKLSSILSYFGKFPEFLCFCFWVFSPWVFMKMSKWQAWIKKYRHTKKNAIRSELNSRWIQVPVTSTLRLVACPDCYG